MVLLPSIYSNIALCLLFIKVDFTVYYERREILAGQSQYIAILVFGKAIILINLIGLKKFTN